MRGDHVAVLYELAGGTSFRSATDVYDPLADRWTMCWDYAYPQELYRIWRHYCTNPDAPVPPVEPTWVQFSGCPDVYYPLVMNAQVSNNTPGGCACCNLTIVNLVHDVSIGTFGGWRGTNTACPGAGVTFTVYPLAFFSGIIAWQLDVTWPGGSAFGGAIYPCGYGPLFPHTIVNAPGICTGADLTVSCYWDWSL